MTQPTPDLPTVLAAIAQLRELAAGIPSGAMQTITDFITQRTEEVRSSQDAVRRIVSELTQATRPEHLLRQVTEGVLAHLGASRVVVYQLLGDGRGRVQMESVQPGFAPTQGMMMPLAAWGLASTLGWQVETVMAMDDRRELLLTDYQQQVMDHLQVLSQAVVPIFVQPSLPWGLLIVQQGDRARAWRETEFDFLQRLSREVSLFLLPLELRRQIERVRLQEELLTQQIVSLSQGAGESVSYGSMAHAIQQFLRLGRVAIWLDWPPGEPRYEAIAPNGSDVPMPPPSVRMLEQPLVFEDLRSPDCSWTDRERQLFLAAEITASASFPFTFDGGRGVLWSAHSLPRRWQPLDLSLMQQVAAQCGLMAQMQQRPRMHRGSDRTHTTQALGRLLQARQDFGEVSLHLQKAHGLSKKMTRLTQLLDGFAAQTNLLALNAALESTRIGELGRSFTVVTDEVRLLSKQSGAALEELNQHLTELLQTAAASLAIAKHGMSQIVESVAQLRDDSPPALQAPDRERKAP
ncbi:MAG: GAF domain-containing protein [Oscillatoriales cyanobacterium SM2_2_1]|nr:GAF domain-containing protein [Oscillatoriales cyanobacterium SM2_2_1]